jgi:thioredoxin 1
VGKVNVDEEHMLAAAFNVQSIPTVVAIKGREVLDLQLGFGGEARLRELFETLAKGKPGN